MSDNPNDEAFRYNTPLIDFLNEKTAIFAPDPDLGLAGGFGVDISSGETITSGQGNKSPHWNEAYLLAAGGGLTTSAVDNSYMFWNPAGDPPNLQVKQPGWYQVAWDIGFASPLANNTDLKVSTLSQPYRRTVSAGIVKESGSVVSYVPFNGDVGQIVTLIFLSSGDVVLDYCQLVITPMFGLK